MIVHCDKGHEHRAWPHGDRRYLHVEHVGTCWVVATRPLWRDGIGYWALGEVGR